MLFTEATSTVGDPYGEARVLRTLTLAPDGAGGWLLGPRDVYVHGEIHETAKDGSTHVTARSCGLDRSAQAACQPHLTPFWAAARVRRASDVGTGTPTGLDLGLLLPDGSLFAPARAPAGEEPSIDDAAPFLLRRIPDAVLPLVAAHAAGPWPPDAERTVEVEVRRGDDLPPLAGTLVLRRAGGQGWKLNLEVDWRVEGPVANGLDWRVEHGVSGYVSVRPDGRLQGGSLGSRTRVLDGAAVVGTARHRLQLGGAAPGPKGDEAADLARLLALRARDETAFHEAVLAQSAASARALVQRVRPEADLAHVSVFLSDQVEPRAWPAGRPPGGVATEDAVRLWRAWAPDLARVVGRAAPRAARGAGREEAPDGADGGDASDTPAGTEAPEPPQEWWREGGAAWTHLGVLTAGRGVVHSLHTLAHEYAHFANERLDYADLERIGVDREAETQRWVDLDGLLALSVLEEAQAEATAACAVLACFDASAQREVIRWYDGQDTRPTAEPDFRRRLYALAYGPSPAVLGPHCDLDDDLEAVLAKAWAAWPYRTQALLFPRDAVSPSRLWGRARSLADEGAVDGTRVGAFTLLFHLDRRGDATHEANLALVRALADDVLLRSADGGLLWVTAWPDAAAAGRFFERIEDTPGLLIRQRGRHVTVCTGGVPRPRAWLGHLLAAEPVPHAQTAPGR